jgi:hypothetical protein
MTLGGWALRLKCERVSHEALHVAWPRIGRTFHTRLRILPVSRANSCQPKIHTPGRTIRVALLRRLVERLCVPVILLLVTWSQGLILQQATLMLENTHGREDFVKDNAVRRFPVGRPASLVRSGETLRMILLLWR